MKEFLSGRTEHERHGFHLLLDPTQLIDATILNYGTWEPPTTKAIEALVKPGMVALDIGANLGWYTLLMARLVGPAGGVVAFEPMDEPRALAQWHLARNRVTNATVCPVLLDEYDRPGSLLADFAYAWPLDGVPVERHSVDRPPVLCLDAWREQESIRRGRLINVDFIKIDVDGYEARILRGACRTLIRCRPTLMLEVCDYTLRDAAGRKEDSTYEYGTETRAMLQGLVDLGYRFRWEENMEPVESIEDPLRLFDLAIRSINLVAEPK